MCELIIFSTFSDALNILFCKGGNLIMVRGEIDEFRKVVRDYDLRPRPISEYIRQIS
jgi:hypothetical protein